MQLFSGVGSKLVVATELEISKFHFGADLKIQNGGEASASAVFIGVTNNSLSSYASGTVEVTGVGSKLVSSGVVSVGIWELAL